MKNFLAYAKEGAELIFCGKLPNFHVLQQETINHLLVKHAKKGKIVTRLKGGDPFVFGRGGEEAEYLATEPELNLKLFQGSLLELQLLPMLEFL